MRQIGQIINRGTRYCGRMVFLWAGDGMAARSNRKPGPFLSFLRPRWGVRNSLFAAFAVIGGIAVLISAGAALVLGHLGASITDLSGRDIPRLAASLQLSARSAILASQGPALLASESEATLNERSKKMKATQQVTLEKLGQIVELGADQKVVSALSETVKNIDDTIGSLGAAARERLAAVAQREKQYEAVRSLHAAFAAAAAPAMIDAQARLHAELQSAEISPDDAAQAAQSIDQLGEAISGGHLAAAEMIAALSATSSEKLDAIESGFAAVKASIRSKLDLLPKSPAITELQQAATKLLALSEGKTGVFKGRQKELDANDYGQIVLDKPASSMSALAS